MTIRTVLAVGVAAVLVASPALAEQGRGPTRDRLERLEGEMLELRDALGEAAAAREEAVREATREAEQRIEELDVRLADLGDELRGVQSAAAALESRIEGQRSRVDDLEAQTEGLVEREEESAARPAVSWTYGSGLRLRSPRGGFELVTRGFVLARYAATFRELSDGWSYGSEFSIVESRLRLQGVLLDGLFTVALEPSFSQGSARIQDGYAEVAPHGAIRIRAGQMRVPFDREWETDRIQLPLDQRGELADRFGRGRDLGAMALGTVGGGHLDYAIGLFNGAGAGMPNDNHDLLFAFRLRYTVLGEATRGWSDLGRSRRPNLSLGIGFTYDLADTEADDGSGRHFNRAVYGLTVDGLVQWQGAHLAAAVHYEATDPGAAGDIVHAYGYYVHAGYLVWTDRLELLARYTALDPDVQGYDDHGREVSAGLTLFLHGQNARLSALYAYQFRLPALAPDDETRSGHGARLQVQGWF